jgi:hypothetical protein
MTVRTVILPLASFGFLGCATYSQTSSHAAAAQHETLRGQVPLQLFERICSDSASLGHVVAAQVINARAPGGLFANLVLRRVDSVNAAHHTFHFEVLRLFDLDQTMDVRAPAASSPADVETTSGDQHLCVRQRATVVAALDDEIARFENVRATTGPSVDPSTARRETRRFQRPRSRARAIPSGRLP